MAAGPSKPRPGGNPPEHARFKKGQSGNPAGRPPKNRDMRKLLEAELDQVLTIAECGKRVRLTKREIIAKKLVNDAAMGDPRMLATLLKLIAGSSEPENPTVPIDRAELARFLMRYLPEAPAAENTPEAEHATCQVEGDLE